MYQLFPVNATLLFIIFENTVLIYLTDQIEPFCFHIQLLLFAWNRKNQVIAFQSFCIFYYLFDHRYFCHKLFMEPSCSFFSRGSFTASSVRHFDRRIINSHIGSYFVIRCQVNLFIFFLLLIDQIADAYYLIRDLLYILNLFLKTIFIQASSAKSQHCRNKNQKYVLPWSGSSHLFYQAGSCISYKRHCRKNP